MRLSQMALAFPFVLSQIIVDGLAYNVGMSKDCNENDDLMISRNNAAPTPSQPREFGCPEQQFKNSTHSVAAEVKWGATLRARLHYYG